MRRSPLDLHRATPAELQQRRDADRAGRPYLLFYDGDDRQAILPLDAGTGRTVLGRSPNATVALAWDRAVSWTHAELECVGDDWVIIDDGLSTNGTFVNRERVTVRRRLKHNDVISVGSTLIALQAQTSAHPETTFPPDPQLAPPQLSDAQKRVLVVLCRPYVLQGRGYPPTNAEIAGELFLSQVTVKAHLRNLNERFGVGPLAQTQKRAELVRRAVESGAVTGHDYL